MDETGSGSYPLVRFPFSNAESSSFATRVET
jgi:hypothetical protein